MQYMVLLIISAFLTSCVSAGIGIPAKYMPQKNPRPKYFLTVEGHIAPSLRKTAKITWVLDYQTTNPKCQSEINDFEGIWVDQYKTLKYVTRSNRQGYFIKKIPLDYYVSGHCGWELDDLNFDFMDIKEGFLTFFGSTRSSFKDDAYIAIQCKKNNCMAIHGSPFNSYSGTVPPEANLKFNFIVTGET